jgi:hypothetical protein
MSDYDDFLARRAQQDSRSGFDPTWMPEGLFGFQTDLVRWAVRQGRAAVFADCGMGKTAVQLAWAHNVHEHTGRPVLVVTPLAVGAQTVGEAARWGVEAATSRDGSVAAPVTVTNYERLERFDSRDFGGVVCDESSAIKAFDGQRRALVTEFLRTQRYRLLCTATAAPNDYVELGTSSEALGQLGHMDMLGRFFTNRLGNAATGRSHGAQAEWRLKGHAEDSFWRWVASWARAARKPSDLGHDDSTHILPALVQRRHVVAARQPAEGTLFDIPVGGLREQRDESRRTIVERCEAAAELLADAPSAVAWCQLNGEGELLTRLIDGAVEVTGRDPVEAKEEALLAFARGEFRVLTIKPSIGAWGLNWQNCHRMTYFPSHSYEQLYQAIRRCWRFGQREDVVVDLVTTEGGMAVLDNLARKADQADRMFAALVAHMHDALGVDRTTDHATDLEVPSWLRAS